MAVRRTLAADLDLIEVFDESVDRFGVAQAERYAAELSHCFDLLAAQPRMARERTVLRPPVRVHPHGSHVIAYRIDEPDIVILRVLHARSDWERELG